MARSAGFLAVFVGLLLPASAPAQAQTPSPARFGRPVCYWEVIPGTRKCELYAQGFKVGLWDADTEKYYRVNVDGSTTGPLVPPWDAEKGDEPGVNTNSAGIVDTKPDPKDRVMMA